MVPWKYPGILMRIALPGAIFRADAGNNQLYLTFDDGPDPEVTPPLLDLLRDYGVTATFFVVANQADWWLELVRRTAAEGHAIGLHGLKHRSGYGLSNRKLWRELSDLREALKQADVSVLPAYRPPFGHIRPDTVGYLRKRGVSTILWSNIPGDFRPLNTDQLHRKAMRGARPGDILVLHDGTRLRPAPVLELTKRLLDSFHAAGWHCSRLSI
ncbi:polysaccharide deacetylase family protein [bacterium]|nr:polysaccharide deacetylase family protein [bacterium]